MGYPMSFRRMLVRNQMEGGPRQTPADHPANSVIAQDLRRVEEDQCDPAHINAYARIAGIRPEQAAKVLKAFFGNPADHQEFGEEMEFAWLREFPDQAYTKFGQMIAERREEVYGS